ncbi:MAG: 3-oxoacyl-[acyl-carrier-protein] reductase [Chloroflexi bacterium]|nr:3-oxoacyl-[acyl-carrier-protein] reductase [Chloroflexota bacterium]
MDLSNKVAIVTGSGRGIGKAIALKLSGYGTTVVVNDLEGSPGAPQVVAEIESKGGKALLVYGNISKAEDVIKLVNQTVEVLGKIDIMVNNAGIIRDKLLMRMTEEDWDMVMDINLRGAFLCSREVVKHMIKQRSGRIINIASIIGMMGNGGQSNYAAAKAGLIALTKSVAKEVASRGITVNAVAPGFIMTDMTAKQQQDSQREEYEKLIPLGRFGVPEDVANAVAFLASEEASYITGHVLKVDGGMVMA